LKEDQVVNTEESAGIEQVSAEVELGRKLVQLGFMRRFDKQHLAVKEAVDSGSIGSPLLFKDGTGTRISCPQWPRRSPSCSTP
jgi:predicted dehydrogenase